MPVHSPDLSFAALLFPPAVRHATASARRLAKHLRPRKK